MNGKFVNVIKDLSYSFFANLFSTFISMILVAIVPKTLGISEYGYWQLYIFYTSYVGFFHFGWVDGVYLRYGGSEYNQLNKSVFHTQYWLLMGFEILITISILMFILFFYRDGDKNWILVVTSLNCFLLIPRTFLQYVLQCTNRIKEYAQNVLSEKIIYGALMLILIFSGVHNYKYLLLADIISKIVTLIMISWICRDIVFSKASKLKDGLLEAVINLRVGIKLMFANVAGMLIIGIVRFGIERTWDIDTFGKISLTMSVSSLMMVFINAVSIVMFPILKRTPKEKWSRIYKTLHTILVIPIFGLLIVYYPMKLILSEWLPQYAESLTYMALMFPMCLYEGKMSMLLNTYLKALRQEKMMLIINIISVFLSLITTYIVVIKMENLPLSVVSIVALLAFRCILAEICLAKKMGVNVIKNIVSELLLTTIFIYSSWFIKAWGGLAIYVVCYIIYLVLEYKNFSVIIKTQFGKLKAQ